MNWTCSFEFVPIASSRIAVCLYALKPAFVKSTDARMIENGSASTTMSAVTVLVAGPSWNVSVYEPPWLSVIATSSEPVVTCDATSDARREATWSLPPRTWYCSFDFPKVRNWPGPT